MIGTSDGEQFNSSLEHAIASSGKDQSRMPQGAPIIPDRLPSQFPQAPMPDRFEKDLSRPIQHNWLTDLFSRTTVKGETYEAPTGLPYPSKEDAEFAQKSEFAYGKPWEQYFDNNIARIVSMPNPSHKTIKDYKQGTRVAASPALLTDRQIIDNMESLSSLTQNPKDLEKSKGLFAEAALATNRHPIASLGFDPANTMLDIISKPDELTIGGATSAFGKTAMYANKGGGKDSSSIVHESIHNGLKKIEEANPELIKQLTGDKPYLSNFMNEMIVRHVMDKVMGNPEEGAGNLSDEQVKQSRWMFNQDVSTNPKVSASKLLKTLEEEAQKLIAQKHPMGPN